MGVIRTDITAFLSGIDGQTIWRAHWWTEKGYSTRCFPTHSSAVACVNALVGEGL